MKPEKVSSSDCVEGSPLFSFTCKGLAITLYISFEACQNKGNHCATFKDKKKKHTFSRKATRFCFTISVILMALKMTEAE